MQVKKRWPILFVVGSFLAYVTNNYTIGGLEHLHLQPRPAGQSQPSGQLDSFGMGFPSTGISSGASFGGRDNVDLLGSTFSALQNDAGQMARKLGVGEKLAVLQDQLSNKIAEVAHPGNVPMPSTSPQAMSMGSTSFADATRFSKPISTGNLTTPPAVGMPTAATIRIATFNLHAFGPSHLSKSHVAETVCRILRQFDCVALQGIQSDRDDIVPMMVERLNQSGRSFDYLIGPRVGTAAQTQQFAFLFDTSRLETDRYQLYTIEDPENLMTYDPLVGWFRCRSAAADEAFTFSLVNLRINRSSHNQEPNFVPNLSHAVAGDGRGEDDIIVAGDYGINPAQISKLNSPSIRFAVRDIPTDVSGQSMLDCIVFPAQGTTEFSGRSGVLDFLRKFNMSIEQASEISPQMPVWAEFYAIEGAHPGKVAPSNSAQVFQ